MARYEIVIDDNDREAVTDGTAWTANLYLVDEETGKTGDALAVGFSGTPAAALEHMVMSITEGDADESAAAFLETGDGDKCNACGRESLACSLNPCDDVLEDRGEARCDECGEPIPNNDAHARFHLRSCSAYEGNLV